MSHLPWQNLLHWFLFPEGYFCPEHTIQLTEHHVKEENTGLYSPLLKLKRSLGLNGTLCAGLCSSESEGTGRQDPVLSSNTSSLRGISLKGEFSGVCRVEQETLPWVLRRSGYTHQAAWSLNVFISVNLLQPWGSLNSTCHTLTLRKHLTSN